VPKLAHEALISWFSSLLWGGFFKDRYAAEIRQAVEIDGSAFRQTLMEVAGKRLGLRLWHAAVDGHAEISAEWTRSLRRAVWWRACLRSPVRTIQRSVAFVIGEFRLRFRPSVPWMAILGPDGGGKSSLVNELVRRFAACPYGNVTVLHWRSRITARAQPDEPVTDSHERPRRGAIGSSWRLLLLAANWLGHYWARWARLRAKGLILAFDHTYFDVVVDHTRDASRAGPRLGRALWRLLPKPDLVFVLDSESNIDEIQRVIRAWMLNRSVATLGVQAPVVTPPTLDAVGSSAAPTSVSRGDRAR
jgi:thymidylate kinase